MLQADPDILPQGQSTSQGLENCSLYLDFDTNLAPHGIGKLLYQLYQSPDLVNVQQTRIVALSLALEHALDKLALKVSILHTAAAQGNAAVIHDAERERLLGIYDQMVAVGAWQRLLQELGWVKQGSVVDLDHPTLRLFIRNLTNPMAIDPDFIGKPR